MFHKTLHSSIVSRLSEFTYKSRLKIRHTHEWLNPNCQSLPKRNTFNWLEFLNTYFFFILARDTFFRHSGYLSCNGHKKKEKKCVTPTGFLLNYIPIYLLFNV